jgi:hypothetical protein
LASLDYRSVGVPGAELVQLRGEALDSDVELVRVVVGEEEVEVSIGVLEQLPAAAAVAEHVERAAGG